MRERHRWAPLALLVACLLALTSAQMTSITGRVTVLSKDKYEPNTSMLSKTVYLRNHTNSMVDGKFTVYKLEGPATAKLRTGMEVTIRGQKLGSLVTGDGAAQTTQVQVFALAINQEPEYPDRQVVVTPPATTESGPGGRGERGGGSLGGRSLLATTPQVAALTSLPTVQLSLEAASASTLVIPISLEGCRMPGDGNTKLYQKPWYTKADVERVVFEDTAANQDPFQTLGGMFRTCSYGATSLTRANSLVVEPVRLDCNGTTAAGTAYNSRFCEYGDFVGWLEAALEKLTAQGVKVDDYSYKMVVLPPGTACYWVGLGYVGCDWTFVCATWVVADVFLGAKRGDPTAGQAGFHEMGHNMFLHHAAGYKPDGGVEEYGDLSCSMGYCCHTRCMNTAHAWQLGWLNPQLLDGNAIGPGETKSLALRAQSASKNSGLKINVTNWAADQPPIFVGYRLGADDGPDKYLPAEQHNRVFLYTYTGMGNHNAEYSFILASLAAGQNYSHAGSGLVIRVISTSPADGSAAVHICRKNTGGAETRDSCLAGLDGDCNWRVGVGDPACTSLLGITSPSPALPPPRPPPPRPPPPRHPPPPPPAGCSLGDTFCTDVAKFAKQALPTANFYVRSASGSLVGQCTKATSKCVGSLVPCACTAALSKPAGSGSGVTPPTASTAARVRCAMGHATCAAKSPGSVCQYWLATGTARPKCSGSSIECSCTAVVAVK